jgi:hypothetical protein
MAERLGAWATLSDDAEFEQGIYYARYDLDN